MEYVRYGVYIDECSCSMGVCQSRWTLGFFPQIWCSICQITLATCSYLNTVCILLLPSVDGICCVTAMLTNWLGFLMWKHNASWHMVPNSWLLERWTVLSVMQFGILLQFVIAHSVENLFFSLLTYRCHKLEFALVVIMWFVCFVVFIVDGMK